ncbi:unnamed protein product [Blepharisma stoltei]|uniref:Anoctamin transmembrane domain-containing protein n=1 Tax=Blepharisma stoltei TaxID=1481888 RepID=A0AAU9IZQ7_9CILI|nr:unnamed protein product [Blepharisma stoltei]
MSAEEEKQFIEEVEDKSQEDDPADLVLIFKNPYTDPDKGLLCQLNSWMKEKEAKQFYRVIFKLHNKETEVPLLKQIEKEIDPLIEGCAKDGWVNLRDIGSSIIENVFKVLQDHLKLEIQLFYSRDCDEIFCRVTCSETNLMAQAELIEYPLQFKKQTMDLQDFEQVSPYGPFKKTESSLKLYKRYDGMEMETSDSEGTLFQYKDRERIVWSIIKSSIDLANLQTEGLLTHVLVLHRKKQLDYLIQDWALNKNPFKLQNIDMLRDYFGEKIAMYLAWIEFLTAFLAPFAIISIILGIMFYAFNDEDDEDDSLSGGEVTIVILAFMLPILSTLYEQFWLREQSKLAWRWGTTGIEVFNEQRPRFRGEFKIDKITGRMKKVVPASHWTTRKAIGFSVLALFIALDLFCVIILFAYRSTLDQRSWKVTAVGVGNAIEIKIFNFIYSRVAKQLNDWENYETYNDYNDMLTLKLFLFQFVNCYSSLFYIAFCKGNFEGCVDEDCIYELKRQFESIFITNFCLNLVEIYLPLLTTKYKIWSEEKRVKKLREKDPNYRIKLTPAEFQAKLSKYDSPLSDYMEIIMTYGYVILFGASFPFSLALLFFLIFIEIKVDAWKLCTLTQRPYPQRLHSIGIWLQIIQAISFIGAGTNIAIIIFTTDAFEIEDTKNKWLIFLILEHSLVILKIVLNVLIPDIPIIVIKGLMWSKVQVDEKLYGKFSDVDKWRSLKNLKFEDPPNYQKVTTDFKSIPFQLSN